jgi:hypothetical protein
VCLSEVVGAVGQDEEGGATGAGALWGCSNGREAAWERGLEGEEGNERSGRARPDPTAETEAAGGLPGKFSR